MLILRISLLLASSGLGLFIAISYGPTAFVLSLVLSVAIGIGAFLEITER